MFNNNKKKIKYLQGEIQHLRLESSLLADALTKASSKKEPAKKTTTKKVVK